MKEITIFVPGIPVSRKTPHPSKGGGFHRQDSDRDQFWMARIVAAALQAKARYGKIEGPVSVKMEFIFPAPKRMRSGARHNEPGVLVTIREARAFEAKDSTPDLDNLEKAVMDAIKNLVIEDDAKVWHKESWKVWGRVAELEKEGVS
jgi:Holliday junction resolvase RusA-like endonuclease